MDDRSLKPVRETIAIARQLRQSMTLEEAILWSHVRGRRLIGAKFRRQHPLAHYIVDFYCPSARLAVELDGDPHNEVGAKASDHVRSRWLADHDIRVIRFTNREVREALPEVLNRIAEAVRSLTPTSLTP